MGGGGAGGAGSAAVLAVGGRGAAGDGPGGRAGAGGDRGAELDGWALAEQLLSDLAALADPVWLVVDDVHELGPDALRQLELVLMRAPAGLRLCWRPGMTCGWGCTGCGWTAGWPRSAPVT